MDVHARDVVSSLVKDQVQGLEDFAWQAQLRTYWQKPQVRVHNSDARMQSVPACFRAHAHALLHSCAHGERQRHMRPVCVCVCVCVCADPDARHP